MSFQFNVTTTTTTSGGQGDRKLVDFEALNAHVVEAAGTAAKSRSIPGVISGIYDLGEQNLEDAEVVFTGTREDEANEIIAKADTYFKDGVDDKGKPCRLKCWPQKPVQQVAIAVDFPQVLVDKGQFFGNSNPLPLRMMLNGEFSVGPAGEKVRVVGRPYNIRETNHAAKGEKAMWAFAKNNGLHKLADAVGILDANGLFKKERIGELLGKYAQFQFRVYMKPGKKEGQTFFTEDIKLVGMVPEGVPLPELPEGILHGVNLYGQNDPAAVKQLRVAVKNTIKRANNYEGSDLQKAFEGAEAQADKPKAESKPVAPKAPEPDADDFGDFDSDIPFAQIGLQEGRNFLHMI